MATQESRRTAELKALRAELERRLDIRRLAQEPDA